MYYQTNRAELLEQHRRELDDRRFQLERLRAEQALERARLEQRRAFLMEQQARLYMQLQQLEEQKVALWEQAEGRRKLFLSTSGKSFLEPPEHDTKRQRQHENGVEDSGTLGRGKRGVQLEDGRRYAKS